MKADVWLNVLETSSRQILNILYKRLNRMQSRDHDRGLLMQ